MEENCAVTAILETISLSKRYVSRQGSVSAIEDVSFEVAEGEFVCVVGPSGCGKTTLLRLLAGLLLPDQGQVLLGGEALTGPRREIGIVFQKANLMPWRTVYENVLLPLQVSRVPSSQAQKQVDRVLGLVDLLEFANSYPRQLSGGMEQRVAIARALAHEPDILLLDEPFGALDALTRERLNLELLRVWGASHKTVVMVTHDIREAVFLADRVFVISQRPGRLADIVGVTLPRPRSSSMLYDGSVNSLAQQIHLAIR